MTEQKAEYLGESIQDEQHEIRDEAPHRFFTMIPHLVYELNLSVYSFRLYAHIKKATGETDEGKCWKSTKTLAKECNMGMGSVSRAKQELENVYPPLIRIVSKTVGEKHYHEMTITDIWKINDDFYTGKHVPLRKVPDARSSGENGRSPVETNKNPINKNPNITQGKKFSSSEKKGDLVDGMIFYANQAVEQKIEQVESTLIVLEKGLRRNIPRTTEWQSLAKWINKQPQKLDVWIEWYMQDNFRRTTSWRMTPQQIKNSWPQAFEEAGKSEIDKAHERMGLKSVPEAMKEAGIK